MNEFNHFLMIIFFVSNSRKHKVGQIIIIAIKLGTLHSVFCKYIQNILSVLFQIFALTAVSVMLMLVT